MADAFVRVYTRFEFWFHKKPKGFYKFIKPCNHRLYTSGDSWCEDLSLSENTFRKYAKIFCRSYPSKESFLKKEDPFMGKPFASYHDRLKKLTFFVKNPCFDKSTLSRFFRSLDCASVCVSNNNKINSNNINPPKSPLNKNPKREEGSISHGDLEKDNQNIPDMAQTIYNIWTEETKEHIKTPKLSPHFVQKLLEAFRNHFGSCVEAWRNYCKKVASSDFLMGKVTSFKAWLIWVIRGDVIEKVRGGAYGLLKETQNNSQNTQVIDMEKITIQNKTFISELDLKETTKESLQSLAKKIGEGAFSSWFRKLSIQEEDEILVLRMATKFYVDQVERLYGAILRNLFVNVRIEMV